MMKQSSVIEVAVEFASVTPPSTAPGAVSPPTNEVTK